MEKLNKKIFQRWLKWIDVIKHDLENALLYQQICRYFEDVYNKNLAHIKANKGATFCDFIRNCYAITAASCIRRQIMYEDKSISLMKLILQMRDYSGQFTYKFYLHMYPLKPNDHEWQRLTFGNFSEDGKILSRKVIEHDIKKIEQIARKVSNYVDRAIAHLDKRGISEKVTYGEISESLAILNKLTCKYLALISSAGYVDLTPTIQYDWEKIFHVPLDIREVER